MAIIDAEVSLVRSLVFGADPTGERFAGAIRRSYDRVYAGQWTGRYSWDQLYKTEKTHFGTLVEIAIRDEFNDLIDDGLSKFLDYRIEGIDVDCKFSMKKGAWMIPRECVGSIVIGVYASDSESNWSLCVIRATEDKLRPSKNRDSKRSFTAEACREISWTFEDMPLPENRLLQMDNESRSKIFAKQTPKERLAELFRLSIGKVVNRESVTAVARQLDYMKRIRHNGGARDLLQPEGIALLSGTYNREIIQQLTGKEIPRSDYIALRLVPTNPEESVRTAKIDGRYWRIAEDGDPVLPGPRVTSR